MKVLSRKDVMAGLVTGLTTGLIAWRVLVYLDKALPAGIDPSVLPFVVPFLWVAGVQLGYVLGAFIRPFTQFGRFACIGFSNAAVDFGILYIGIAATGATEGVAYTIMKAISFSVATVHSYLWNKYWTFESSSSEVNSREVSSFVGVSVVSLLVNVGVASLVVAVRPETIAGASWAGIAAVIGSAAAIIFSFTGFRVFVFKK